MLTGKSGLPGLMHNNVSFGTWRVVGSKLSYIGMVKSDDLATTVQLARFSVLSDELLHEMYGKCNSQFSV